MPAYGFQCGGGAFEVRVRHWRDDAHALRVLARWQRWMMPKAILRLTPGNMAAALVRDSRAWKLVRWHESEAGVIRDWDPVRRWEGEAPPLQGFLHKRAMALALKHVGG